jgi:hypothetical protein
MKMSRLKGMKGLWGFVAGIAVVLVVLPAAAVAGTNIEPAVLSYVGIKGTSGSKANVEPDGQIYTTNAPPQNLFANQTVLLNPQGVASIVSTPAGYDAIVTSVGVDMINTEFALFVGNSACSAIYDEVRYLQTNTQENIELTFPTGVPIPNGDALCADNLASGSTFASADGYAVTAGSVAAIQQAPHPLSTLPKP